MQSVNNIYCKGRQRLFSCSVDMTWNMEGEESAYYNMDNSELAKIIFSKIQNLEPVNALKIIGCIFLKDPSNLELFQLAFGTEDMLLSRINDAKSMLCMLSSKASNSVIQFGSFTPHDQTCNHLNDPTSYCNPQLVPKQQYPSLRDLVIDDCSSHNHTNLPGLKEQVDAMNQIENYYLPEVACGGGLTSVTSRRSHSLSELQTKACHYFNKGYCKHGNNCRFLHSNLNNAANGDQCVTPSLLEKLEMEIVELLRSANGPISIASLPTLYCERYGRNLQAEGYLAESQRHVKTGYNLTMLLDNLKNSIRLVLRPHGQHFIVLAEDATRYMELRNERNGRGMTSSSSHQIYLTFPSESTFTADDVLNYFSQYGRVQDVRIPCQDKRMFGFVSFVNPETVTTVLMKGNPHFICGARVLVKPYREKSRTIDRLYPQKIKPMISYPNPQMDPCFHSMSQESNNSRLLSKQLIVDDEKLVEDERMRLCELNLASKSLAHKPFLNYGIDLKASGPIDLPFIDHFGCAIEASYSSSTSDDKARQTCNSLKDHESIPIELPESPFASTHVESSISAVI